MTDHDAPDDGVRDDQWNGSRADSIIARIVDRCADPEDWEGLREVAQRAPGTWEDLLEALRLDSELASEVQAALAVAERVELPSAAQAPHARVVRMPRAAGWTRWTGWAAAAVLALAWYGAGPGPELLPARPGAGAPEPVAQHDAPVGLSPDVGSSADGPRPRFLDGPSSGVSLASDEVVSELPMQVLETRPSADGKGYDVYYVRRMLQRTHVGQVYSLGLDEHGQPAPVTVDPALLASADSL